PQLSTPSLHDALPIYDIDDVAVRGRDAEEVHVGARVARPQGAVDVERAGRARHREPLGENDLEHLSGSDVLLRGLDEVDEGLLGDRKSTRLNSSHVSI